jgi:TfoX/Sxy family transcriptional regulator of competence genes
MAYDEHMANRVRELIALRTSNVEEKKIFGGLCFMVDDKICVAVKTDKMFTRLAPDVYEKALELDGITTMSRGHTIMKGYIYIDFDQLQTQKQLAHWVNLALDFNPLAKSSKQK